MEHTESWNEIKVMSIANYDAATHSYYVQGFGKLDGRLGNLTQKALWVNNLPSKGGYGSFVTPDVGDAVLCLLKGSKIYERNQLLYRQIEQVYILGFIDLPIIGDTLSDVSTPITTPGDVVHQYTDGSYELISAAGIKHTYDNVWAQELRNGVLQEKKTFWRSLYENFRGGLSHFLWDYPPDELLETDLGNTRYKFVIAEGSNEEDDSDDLEGFEDISTKSYSDKLIIKSGRLVNSTDVRTGHIVAEDDVGAIAVVSTRQKKDSNDKQPSQWLKLVFGRVTSGLKQLFRFTAWSKDNSSKLDIVVNKNGYNSSHGVTLTHQQLQGNVEIVVSTEDKGIYIKVNNTDISVNYDGDVIINSPKIYLGGGSTIVTEPSVLGQVLVTKLSALINAIENMSQTVPGAGITVVPPLNIAQFEAIKTSLTVILAETTKVK